VYKRDHNQADVGRNSGARLVRPTGAQSAEKISILTAACGLFAAV
jgi:hypothetical protein